MILSYRYKLYLELYSLKLPSFKCNFVCVFCILYHEEFKQLPNYNESSVATASALYPNIGR